MVLSWYDMYISTFTEHAKTKLDPISIFAHSTHLFLPHHDDDNGIAGNRDPACSMGWRTYRAALASPPRRAEVAQRWAGAISRGGGIELILV